MSWKNLIVLLIVSICMGCTAEHKSQTLTDQSSAVSVVPSASSALPILAQPENKQLQSPCPEDMVHVKGNFCSKRLIFYCLDGYLKVNGVKKRMHWPLPGITGVDHCIKFNDTIKGVCQGTEVSMDFCIDRYEYPNKKGEIPKVMVSWNQSRVLCEAQGKHLCRTPEWKTACLGPERTPFPYGWERDPAKCLIMKPVPMVYGKRLNSPDQSVRIREMQRILRDSDLRQPSGTYEQCVSGYGVHDMTGSVGEWTDHTGFGAKYPSTSSGGHMWGEVRGLCEPLTGDHDQNFFFVTCGFRCCK